jgi:hypothetical protein
VRASAILLRIPPDNSEGILFMCAILHFLRQFLFLFLRALNQWHDVLTWMLVLFNGHWIVSAAFWNKKPILIRISLSLLLDSRYRDQILLSLLHLPRLVLIHFMVIDLPEPDLPKITKSSSI